jgi:hypothetical protein
VCVDRHDFYEVAESEDEEPHDHKPFAAFHSNETKLPPLPTVINVLKLLSVREYLLTDYLLDVGISSRYKLDPLLREIDRLCSTASQSMIVRSGMDNKRATHRFVKKELCQTLFAKLRVMDLRADIIDLLL